jgi:hypothetical protein
MDILCVDFRGSDDPVDSLFLLDQDWVDIGEPASRNVAKPHDPDENKIPGLNFDIYKLLLTVRIYLIVTKLVSALKYYIFCSVKLSIEFTEQLL